MESQVKLIEKQFSSIFHTAKVDIKHEMAS